MNQDRKTQNLQLFLRVYGTLTLLIFGTLSIAFLFKIPNFNPGGNLNWMIWDDIFGHVAPMLFAIYLVWGVFFFIAAKEPAKHTSFLNFTMWANLLHGLLMIPMALNEAMHQSKFLTDIPFILVVPIAICAWRPPALQATK
jgi:FtsH-binding integral membrane protein